MRWTEVAQNTSSSSVDDDDDDDDSLLTSWRSRGRSRGPKGHLDVLIYTIYIVQSNNYGSFRKSDTF